MMKTPDILKYTRVPVLGCLLTFTAMPGVVSAQKPAPAIACSRSIEQAVLAGNYPLAERTAKNFLASDPENPAGLLLLASVLQYEAVDYEDFSRGREFQGLLGETERLANVVLEQHPGDTWALYYRAAAEGLGAAYASLSGSKIAGLRKGRSSAVQMSRIIETDPAFYDAYLMHGSYLFWKSLAIKPISWLPFIEDEENRGVEEVEQAVGQGTLYGPLSNTVLLEILLRYDPERARVLGEELSGRYPSCRLFAWQWGEACKRLGRMEDARVVFTRIAGQMRDDPADDGSGPLRCWWKLAELAHDTGNTELCVYYCGLIGELEAIPAVAARQHERIIKARELMKECR